MEFKVSSAELLKGVVNVSKAIPAKTSLPILENFLFVLTGDGLRITASDQELTLQTTVAVESTREEGSIAVPARQLIELLKALPDQPIDIKTSGAGSFDCIWNNGNSSLPYFPAEDFPEIKGVGEQARNVTFPADVLLEGINSTVYATADDEMRPTMNGIFFDMGEQSTTLVASDSHKLICYTTPAVKMEEGASFILHKKPAAVIKSLLDKETEPVQVAFDEGNVTFRFGNMMMLCRLVVGKYPRYRDVIPQKNANILRIDRLQLLNTVRRVAVCANKASNHIKFDLKPGQLEITAQDLGFALAAYEKIECDYAGENLSVGFKSSFLIEILSNMGCETLLMKFADARKAALIVPSEDDEANGKLCGIIMPMMVS
ncbi:MAG: DNA polymerase III subunit beta [Bacteroidales bacterium]|nr:DNA polymerase III subunit beta [Bacteroidales bacterium]